MTREQLHCHLQLFYCFQSHCEVKATNSIAIGLFRLKLICFNVLVHIWAFCRAKPSEDSGVDSLNILNASCVNVPYLSVFAALLVDLMAFAEHVCHFRYPQGIWHRSSTGWEFEVCDSENNPKTLRAPRSVFRMAALKKIISRASRASSIFSTHDIRKSTSKKGR